MPLNTEDILWLDITVTIQESFYLNKFQRHLRLPSWIRLSKCWNAWCVVLISHLFKLRCHHYGCNDTSSGLILWNDELSTSCFTMPGQIGKCSSCGKLKETSVIECSSCEQWLPHCCAGVSAGDDVVEFESVPFYCSQCLSTDRQQPCSSRDLTQCYHCYSQTGSRKKKTIQCSQCDRPFHLSCVKISSHANKLPGWYWNTCDPILNPSHPEKNQHEHLPDWPRFLWHSYSIPKISQPPYPPHPQGSTPFFCLRT